MTRFVRGAGVFIVGLGTSLVVGWWLKQRERQSTESDSLVITSYSAPGYGADEMPSITLPPEAFLDVEPAQNIVLSNEVVADDLTEISGIGAKTVETLNSLGIFSFADLANADAESIKAQITRASIETIQGWIATAKERAG